VKNQASSELLKAIAVCCRITGTDLPQDAVIVMADDLARYPQDQVLGALTRCRREVRYRLTLADVIERLADGRPGPQEAWAIVAPTLHDEGPTIVWTDEMAQAMGVARMCDDAVAARMAFLESYRALCQQARDAGVPVNWTPCLGFDKAGRDGPLLAAVTAKKLTSQHAGQFLIGESASGDLRRLSTNIEARRITAPEPTMVKPPAPPNPPKSEGRLLLDSMPW
jgi:hypothetical protein